MENGHSAAIREGRSGEDLRKMPTPLVTIVIPVHNRLDLLRRAIASVCAQTTDSWELIVVDDGSDVDVGASLSDIADPRIRTIRLDTNRGAPTARNMGAARARGRFVTFLDSDDELRPDFLVSQLDALGGLEKAVLCGFTEKSGDTLTSQVPPARRITFDQLILGPQSWITTGQLMVGTDLARSVGFDASLAAYQDWDFLVRLARAIPIIANADILLVKHEHARERIYAGSRKHRALLAVARKHARDIASQPEVARSWNRKVALAQWQLGDFPAARTTLLQAHREDPKDRRVQRLALASRLGPVVFGAYLWTSFQLRRVRKVGSSWSLHL